MNQRYRTFMAWSSTRQGKKLLRFTLVSVITTAISLGSVAILYGFRIIPGVQWATLAGNLIGTLPAYHLNRRWTWGKRGRSRMRSEIVPFWSLSFLGIAFSQLGAWWVKQQVNEHHWSHLLNTVLVVGTNLFSFAIFWVLKLMVFNKIFHTDPLGDIEEKLTLEEEGVN
jgi:putative flippase GtrA